MMSLKDYEKELNKCSRCGLCQSVCPIYQITKNECTVSKGKFTMLLGAAKGDLKLSENINKYLDMCLKCGKCSEYCPAGIDVCTVLNTAKYEYSKKQPFFNLLSFIQSKLFFHYFINIFENIINPPKNYNSNQTSLKVLYFKGCVNKIFPNTDKYISKIFKNIPIEIVTPNFKCCGLPFLSEGNLEEFIKNAKFNTEIINREKYDYLITDCASCESTILDYNKYLNNLNIEPKSINWGELIAQKNLKFNFNKPITVTFHKPCHLKNSDFVLKIMGNCKNVKYIEMNRFDDCCGFAGTFGIKNPKISKELIKNKAKNIKNTNADYVITTCPSCLAGLNLGLLGTKTRAINLLEFLASADEILY